MTTATVTTGLQEILSYHGTPIQGMWIKWMNTNTGDTPGATEYLDMEITFNLYNMKLSTEQSIGDGVRTNVAVTDNGGWQGSAVEGKLSSAVANNASRGVAGTGGPYLLNAYIAWLNPLITRSTT